VVARRQQLPVRAQAKLLTDYAGAVAYTAGNYARAQQIYEEAAALWRTLDDAGGLAWTTCLMGGNAEYREEYAQAEALWQEGLALFRRSGSGDMEIAWALYGLGGVARLQGDVSRAAEFLAESLALQRASDAKVDPAWTLVRAGQVAQLQGSIDQAIAFVQEGVQRHREMGNRRGAAEGLVVLGRIALAQKRVARAIQLFGAADALLTATGWQMYPKDRQDFDRDIASGRELLGEERFRTAWSAGQAMTLEQAVDYALSHMDT
jgi:tetratricopeptide (TPR) repeat protein